MPYCTWEDDALHEIVEQEENLLDAISLLSYDDARVEEQRGEVVWCDPDWPTPEETDRLFHPVAKGADFYKAAKSTLPHASPFYQAIFDPSRPLAASYGSRYTRLRSAVAWASCYLCGVEGVTPQHVFALFFRAVEQWGDDDDGTPFVERLAIFVAYFWSIDEARLKSERLEAQVAAQTGAGQVQEIIDGIATWHAPIAEMRYEEAVAWARRHAIVYVGGLSDYYVMTLEGGYAPIPVNSKQLLSGVIANGLSCLLTLRNEEGKFVPPQTLIDKYATRVGGIVYQAGRTHAQIIYPDTERAKLQFGVYALRCDLEPRYDADVDEWLQQFAGNRYETLCEWVAHALAFDYGALALLSISGKKDSGKNLLVQGLAECLTVPAIATDDDLLGDHQYGLLASPFCVINEGWARKYSGKHPADKIREVVGDSDLFAKQKFKPVVTIRTNLRVIVTANDHETILRLGAGHFLSESARAALADRIIHIDIPETCAGWLAKKGGMDYTSAAGRQWIKPQDLDEPGDHIVARHFLWLHSLLYGEGKKPVRKTRFLMHGSIDQPIFNEMRITGDNNQFLVTVLIDMLNEVKSSRKKFDKLVVEDSMVWVLAGGVRDYAKTSDRYSSQEIPGVKHVANALANLSKPFDVKALDKTKYSSCGEDHITLVSRKQLRGQRWKLLDIELLRRTAQEWQYPCPLLDELIEGASITKIETARAAVAQARGA